MQKNLSGLFISADSKIWWVNIKDFQAVNDNSLDGDDAGEIFILWFGA